MTNPVRQLADDYWDFYSEMLPTLSHMRGDYRFIDQETDYTEEGTAHYTAKLRDFALRARQLQIEGAEGDDVVTLESLIFLAEAKAALLEVSQLDFGFEPVFDNGFSPVFGAQAMLPVYSPRFSIETAEHADAMVGKMHAIGIAFDQMSERLRKGLAQGRVSAQFAVDKTVPQLDAWLALPIEDDPLLATKDPSAFGEAETEQWRNQMAEAVTESIRPALARYRDVIRDEIGPKARSNEKPGLCFLPDGEVVYARALHHFTTLSMPAEEVHQIGLQQVASLDEEYREIAGPLLGSTDLEEIYSRLRDDPEVHHTTAEGVIAASEVAFEKARAAMPDWFNVLPMTDCVVRDTKRGAVAYYFPPATDGSRPGMFFMNTDDPTSWATYDVESTSFHEGIPGHHLQIAIAQELGDAVPAFRRHTYIGAYAEGWGLYTERLADEMGMYGSELDRVGMLSADSTRACRLVVDTGLHAMGWTRQQAIDYMADNSPAALHTIEAEVDRYIGDPGQACSYMIGRLEIQRMRREAEAAMGSDFDIKGFHDATLTSGEVPLDTLDRLVREWSTA